MSLRDQIIANASSKKSKDFMGRLSVECQAMIAEGILLFRTGNLPINSMSELSRSLGRIAEKQFPEDHDKWPEKSAFNRLCEKMTDEQLNEIMQKAKTKQPPSRKK